MTSTEFSIRGGGTVLEPNHITRYIYPSLLRPKEDLFIHSPHNCAQRPRPQGQGAYDTTFTTITASTERSPPVLSVSQWTASERSEDQKSDNALGRAMGRVTNFPGNTTLEFGMFIFGDLKKGRVIVVKRTTILAIEGGRFERDDDTYEIRYERLIDIAFVGTNRLSYDSWYARIVHLIHRVNDRAYWNVQERLDELEIVERRVHRWLPRQDITSHCTIFEDPGTANLPDDAKQCPVCMRSYFEKDFPVKLPCAHYICLSCIEQIHDDTKPETSSFHCPFCRRAIPVQHNRLDNIHASELPYWRWRTVSEYMNSKMTGIEFNLPLEHSVELGYIPYYHAEANDNGEDLAITYVRAADAIAFMRRFVLNVAALLPWGLRADNPVTFKESKALIARLELALRWLGTTREEYNLQGLTNYLLTVSESVVGTNYVVQDKNHNLGNPDKPPGYEAFRKWVCEWTARGAFLAPYVVKEHIRFVERMRTEPSTAGVWWKGHEFLEG